MSVDLLEQAFASTAGVLAKVQTDQLDDPTPCASWNVRELINHIVGGTHFFAGIAETGGVPEGGGTPPDFSAGDFNAAFASGAQAAVAAFRAPGVMEKTMKLPFGEFPGSVFVMIAATDTYAHGWDLAKALGESTDLDPAIASAILGAAMIPDQFRGPEGAPFGPIVEVDASACPADRAAGYLGRQP
ncbi:MAG: TIGR03086 family protein [Actinobacteria bacterium]|nr:TIGR03086 family protein [Actinomycetota bacterium]